MITVPSMNKYRHLRILIRHTDKCMIIF